MDVCGVAESNKKEEEPLEKGQNSLGQGEVRAGREKSSEGHQDSQKKLRKKDCLRGQEQPQTFLQLRQEEDQGQDGCGTSETGREGCDGRHRNGGSFD